MAAELAERSYVDSSSDTQEREGSVSALLEKQAHAFALLTPENRITRNIGK